MATVDDRNSTAVEALALGQIECASLLLNEGNPLDLQRAAEVVIDKGQYEALKFVLSNYKLDVDKHFLLHRALVGHQEDIARLLVESGADVNNYHETRPGLTDYEEGCAHYSCYLPFQLSLFCSLDMTRFLLEFGADVNKRDYSGQTALTFACATSVGADRVAFLLGNGVNVHDRDLNNVTGLHWAARLGYAEKLTLLINHGADIEAGDVYGCTALMWACSSPESVDCLKILLEKGADCRAKNFETKTGFHLAARSGNSMALKQLIQYGAQLEARTRNGDTALILACGESVPAECVRILLENGAFPNVKNTDKKTPLNIAKETKNEEKIQLLLQYGATEEDRIDQGETNLMLACGKTGNVRSVLSLLEKNTSPNVKNHRGQTALHLAVVTGDIETLKVLVQYKADVNAMTDGDKTPLMLACAYGSVKVKCAHLLLENQALPNVTDIHGDTALHWALRSGDNGKIEILVQYGTDVNPIDSRNQTPLMLACDMRHVNVKCVQLLLENQALLNVTDINGDTALHKAVCSGDNRKVEILVQYGACVNARNRHIQTPLMLACKDSSVKVKCVQLLLENHALLNVTDIHGDTALHKALCSGDNGKVEILVQYGADVNARDGLNQTPLMLACKDSFVKVKCVHLLLKNHALLNVTDINGDTALHKALCSGDNGKVEILVQYGADVNARDGLNQTPLMLACKDSSVKVKCVQLLLENHALLNVTDINGDTALHKALCSGDDRKVEILVEYGANVNARGIDNQTPLILACGRSLTTASLRSGDSRRETVKLLVEHGADLEVRTLRGRTPFLFAVQTENFQVIRFLHDLGADICAEDVNGQNAIMLVIERNHRNLELLQYLIDKGVSVNHRDKNGWSPLMLVAKYKGLNSMNCLETVKCLLNAGADVHAVRTEKTEGGRREITLSTPLSIMLDDIYCDRSGCAEELIRRGAVNSLPERYNDFLHQMIRACRPEVIHLLLTNGMAPTLSDSVKVLRFSFTGVVSPLTVALFMCWRNIPVIQYLLGNLMLCPCDVYGHSYFSQWRHRLISENKIDIVTLMDEFYYQPKSLFQLSFVTVSHALGGVPGRVDRVSSLPLPSNVKDKLLFKNIDVPLDFF